MAAILINLGVIDNTITLGDADHIITGINGNNTLTIGAGNNQLTLGNGNNTLTLGGGTDNITAGSGNNTVTTSGAGADTILFTSGNNTITVGGGPSVITTGNGLNIVTTGDGNNTITLGNGFDQVTAGNGNSTIIVGNGAGDIITVGSGSNRITIGTGVADIVHTAAGSNTLTVSAVALGADTIMGALGSGNGAGNTVVVTTAGIVSLTGVTGFETFQLATGGANTVSVLNANFVRLPAKSISVVAGNSGDTIDATTLSAANSVMVFGGSGNDLIQSGLGNDSLTGGAGTNRIDGGGGVNTAVYSGLRSSYQALVYQGSVLVHGANASDTLTSVQALQFADQTVQVSSLVITSTATQIGTVNGFQGTGERDLFLRTGAGQLVQWSYDSNNALVGGSAFSYQGNAWMIDAATRAVGTGQSFWGYGGRDVVLRMTTGQMVVSEFDNAGSALDSIALTYLGNAWVIDATTTAIGTGQGFWGYGGHDIFLRSASGQFMVHEVDDQGHVAAGLGLTYLGNSWVIDASTTAIGSGQGFWGYGWHDAFLRSSTGQMLITEVDDGGVVGKSIGLTYSGAAWTVDSATRVIGAGQNFWGYGGHDAFLRSGTGQLIAQEFSDAGGAARSTALTYAGNAWTIDAMTTAIGVGQNFWGYSGHDVFLRGSNGQLTASEFDADGGAIDSKALTFGGAAWTVDTATHVIGTGRNFGGTGGADVFLLTGQDQIAFGEFNASGLATTAGMTFITSAIPGATIVNKTSSIAGTAQNLLGQGEKDLVLRELGGSIHLWAVSNANALLSDLTLKFTNGNAATLGITETVTGSGQNLLGMGGHDISITNAVGHITIWEFNNSGTVIGAQ